MTDYVLGNRIRIIASFTDTDDVAADPDALTLKIKRHNASTETTYTFGVDADIVKDSVGEYHADIDPDAVGWWMYYWAGTGDNAGATEGSFRIVKEYH